MKDKKTELTSFRINEEEKEIIEFVSDALNETKSENICNSLRLRHDLLKYLYNEKEIDDEDILQFQDILKIVMKNLKI